MNPLTSVARFAAASPITATGLASMMGINAMLRFGGGRTRLAKMLDRESKELIMSAYRAGRHGRPMMMNKVIRDVLAVGANQQPAITVYETMYNLGKKTANSKVRQRLEQAAIKLGNTEMLKKRNPKLAQLMRMLAKPDGRGGRQWDFLHKSLLKRNQKLLTSN